MNNRSYSQHAVVIGGSIAGLLAARVLADFFEKVTIIERDELPESASHRKGVPQSKHVHVLLAKGEQILEQLFPNFGRDLDDMGAASFDIMRDVYSVFEGRKMNSFVSGISGRAASRIGLESLVRRRVRALGNVDICEQTEVRELLTTADKLRITGVALGYRGGATGPEKLAADLVVDASGRSSKTPKWLAALGYEAPEETIVNSFLGYGTRLYQKPADFDESWKMMFIFATPENPRGGIIMELEDGSWIMTVAGASHNYPPMEETEFMAFTKKASPLLHDWASRATPISDISGYRRTENRWLRYEKLGRLPEHFIIMGDAVCGFNPIYGQGMSSASLQALALRRHLAQANGTFAQMTPRFQKEVAKIASQIWMLATNEDFRYPATEGERQGLTTKFTHWFMDKMRAAAHENQAVVEAFVNVQQLLEPPTHLFQPRVIGPVVKQMFRGG